MTIACTQPTEKVKVERCQSYFLVKPDDGVDIDDNTDKDDDDLEDGAAAGEEAILRTVLLYAWISRCLQRNGRTKRRYQLLRYICRTI